MRAARPFLIVVALVLALTGTITVLSLVGQDDDTIDPDECVGELATVDVDGTAVALDDQAAVGADPCDLRRRGPTPTIPYVAYDCRIVVPAGYAGTDLPERIEPTHPAQTCRQGAPATTDTTTNSTTSTSTTAT